MPRTLRRRMIALGLLVGLGVASHGVPAGAADHSARILDLRWRLTGETATVTVRLSAPVRHRTSASDLAVAVDLWTVRHEGDRTVAVGGGVASSIWVRRLTPEVVRLTISLRRPGRFKVFAREDRLTINVFPIRQGAIALPKGVTYRSLLVATRAGRARAHVVTIDPRAPGIEIRSALGGGAVAATEATSTAATRLEAAAAINGNYYSRAGLPLGLVVLDGRILSAPLPRRTAFGVDAAGRPWIGTVEFGGRLVADTGMEVPISAVNRPPRASGVALYTPEFGPHTPPQALVAVVRGGRIAAFSSGRPAIPSDGYALAAASSQQHFLTNLVREQRVTVHLALEPRGLHHALQGGPRLVRAGAVEVPYAWEGFGRWFARVRTARSAIGITRNGTVLFVTVDRRAGRRGRMESTGMDLFELASLMRSLGARDAVNLDGGGSATLVVGGRVVSAPPRAGERRVSAMLVARHRPAER
ncbi:MAG: phosphodiester glycosidase family protein [Armatimonadetes bacterium]|nr:phosphodiester glycosidase family protein [Armatimonadota bacterium]